MTAGGKDHNVIDPLIIAFPIVSLSISFICICLPIRTWLRKSYAASSEGNQDQTAYRKKATQFTDCYDISNPMTAKQGKIRLIDLQMEDLAALGEEGEEQLA